MDVTEHVVYFQNSGNMDMLKDESVHLVVTSPPYPMVEMWDSCFRDQIEKKDCSVENKPSDAFEMMHLVLESIWRECFRILKPGCYMCINIGDAVRTVNKEFQLYNNHARIVEICQNIGFITFPGIIWSKPVNAPNKFMGSGCLPCNAYVTLEHEHILVFRKPGKRVFETDEDKDIRKESSIFFEERNIWYSDIWRINGTRQKINKKGVRERNASYPLEIPYRLINMFSCIGDTVVDPFYGLGTTALASIINRRNSIGFEIDSSLREIISSNISGHDINEINKVISDRYNNHLSFIRERKDDNKDISRHYNDYLKCPVTTSSEEHIKLYYLKKINTEKSDDNSLKFNCLYNSNKNVNESFNENALF